MTRSSLVAVLLLLGHMACSRDRKADDPDAGGEEDAGDPLPLCTHAGAAVGVTPRALDSDDPDRTERVMFVVRSAVDGLDLEDDLWCEPDPEAQLLLTFPSLPEGARLPPVGAEVRVGVVSRHEGSYARVSGVDGELLWEGGQIFLENDELVSAFAIDGTSAGEACTTEVLPPEDACCCTEFVPLRGAVITTDDGLVQVDTGEPKAVTLDGREYVALVTLAENARALPCIDDGETGVRLHAYLVAAFEPPDDPGPEEPDACP